MTISKRIKESFIGAIISTLLIALTLPANAQGWRIQEDFKPVCDTLANAFERRTTVRNKLMVKNVMIRKNSLDFYFTVSLGDYPWKASDVEWFRDTLKKNLPHRFRKYNIGNIYSRGVLLDSLTVPEMTFDGSPAETSRIKNKPHGMVLVKKEGQQKFNSGLQDRHIALWQSHGRYFDVNSEQWRWQRPNMFNICEDLFTQSFVLPFLVPMLENAGAYVMLPRERDIQDHESIADNDEIEYNENLTRVGNYEEHGTWSDAGEGFKHLKCYIGEENPFCMGTARKAKSIANEAKGEESRVIWRADIPERGEYAVYISYKTLPESVSCAHYKVCHMGGESGFIVNQRMGGGTWIYLGTFEFDKGSDGYVELVNRVPDGYKHQKGEVVTADAVRFGGGMGNIARSRKYDALNDTIPHYAPQVSGLPRSAEAARYWLQWAGVPSKIFSQNEESNDYKDDFMSRGDWVAWMSGGSVFNLKEKGKRIPFDLAFGFHSDAGITQDSTVIGTLAIYTLTSENKKVFPDGNSRMASREFADLVQSQIVNDLRELHDPDWSRRCTWDRGYRESRTPTCPSMLLELLSHQNFNDMKFGLDPTFRFNTSRAIYKGMLKYLSNRYEQRYIVQPLPVKEVSVNFTADTCTQNMDEAVISWKRTDDPIESTAKADGYILQTRIDDGAFDQGQEIQKAEYIGNRFYTKVKIEPGHIYSYRIIAYNKGGKSFASEVVSIGVPEKISPEKAGKRVAVINNFDRVSGPAFFETEEYAGFLTDKESGVPMGKDIAFTGAMYDFNKTSEYTSDSNPGFGASYNDNLGKIIAGNTFDYAHIHGKALIKAGYPFCSCSKDVFCADSLLRSEFWAIDIICGKQLTTLMPDGSEKFKVFPEEMQDALRCFTSKGGNVIISGSYIGTDLCQKVYPIQTDTTYRKKATDFAKNVLGYRFNCNFGSRTGALQMASGGSFGWTDLKGFKYIHNTPNSKFYCAEHPDGIAPASKNASIVARYADTGAPAAITYKGNGYRTVCYGFPLETLKKPEDLQELINASLSFISE